MFTIALYESLLRFKSKCPCAKSRRNSRVSSKSCLFSLYFSNHPQNLTLSFLFLKLFGYSPSHIIQKNDDKFCPLEKLIPPEMSFSVFKVCTYLFVKFLFMCYIISHYSSLISRNSYVTRKKKEMTPQFSRFLDNIIQILINYYTFLSIQIIIQNTLPVHA